jgi:hypothetical protein
MTRSLRACRIYCLRGMDALCLWRAWVEPLSDYASSCSHLAHKNIVGTCVYSSRCLRIVTQLAEKLGAWGGSRWVMTCRALHRHMCVRMNRCKLGMPAQLTKHNCLWRLQTLSHRDSECDTQCAVTAALS